MKAKHADNEMNTITKYTLVEIKNGIKDRHGDSQNVHLWFDGDYCDSCEEGHYFLSIFCGDEDKDSLKIAVSIDEIKELRNTLNLIVEKWF